MADELNTPNHRYYQNRYNVELAPNEMSKQWILASGIARIDNAAVLPLFASTEPGVWYDPSDLTTLFQDNAGATPVTAPAQTVGLMLDKSQGLVLGSERIVNGDFASGSTSWTLGANWAVSGAAAAATASSGNINQVMAGIVVGRSYLVEFDVTVSSGSLRAELGGSFGPTVTSSGRYRTILTSLTGAVSVLYIYGPTAFTGTVDNISVKLLAGNHATQATSTQRPTYGINPITGTRNLLTYTEQFDNAVWTLDNSGATNPVVTANFGTAPDGTLTADRIQLNKTGGTFSRIQQPKTGLPSAVYTFSVYLRNNAVGTANVGIRVDATGINCAVTDTWQRFSVTLSPAGTAASAQILLFDSIIGNDETADILAWGAQLELGSTVTAYQKVVSQYEVTEAGVQSAGYLAFDGVDDGMVTNTITPAIDKVQVFAGVRKLSDAATATLASFGGASANSWELFAPRATNNYYVMAYRTTTALEANNFTAVAPDTAVLTGTGDISAPAVTLRRNGVVSDTNTTALAFANFAAYPLYIGRRGGSSLPYNGRLYSLITRFGDNLTDSQIASAESWVNAKTGAY